jgi:hypothetical protein
MIIDVPVGLQIYWEKWACGSKSQYGIVGFQLSRNA